MLAFKGREHSAQHLRRPLENVSINKQNNKYIIKDKKLLFYYNVFSKNTRNIEAIKKQNKISLEEWELAGFFGKIMERQEKNKRYDSIGNLN